MRNKEATCPLLKNYFLRQKTIQTKAGTNMSKNEVISHQNPDVLTCLLRLEGRNLSTKAVQ